MLKPISAIGSAMALLLAVAMPAMAITYSFPDYYESKVKIDLVNVADTGNNTQSNVNLVEKANHVVGINLGLSGGDRFIGSGKATATTYNYVGVNSHVTDTPTWWMDNSSYVYKNNAEISLANSANSGGNAQDNLNSVTKASKIIVGNAELWQGNRTIFSGPATATSYNTVKVNSGINTSIYLH